MSLLAVKVCHDLQWHICKDMKETAETYDSLQSPGVKDVDFFQTFSAPVMLPAFSSMTYNMHMLSK